MLLKSWMALTFYTLARMQRVCDSEEITPDMRESFDPCSPSEALLVKSADGKHSNRSYSFLFESSFDSWSSYAKSLHCFMNSALTTSLLSDCCRPSSALKILICLRSARKLVNYGGFMRRNCSIRSKVAIGTWY